MTWEKRVGVAVESRGWLAVSSRVPHAECGAGEGRRISVGALVRRCQHSVGHGLTAAVVARGDGDDSRATHTGGTWRGHLLLSVILPVGAFRASFLCGQDAAKMEFVSAYMALMDVYEARCEALHASVDAACDALVAQSRIPELAEDGLGGGWGVGDRRGDGSRGGRPDGRREEGGGGGKDSNRAANGDGDEGDGGGGSGSGDDDEEEDLEVLQRRVRRKFVAAMEQLQCSRLPKRRRGNLPKEATAVFRSWFAANLDHPYPTDAVKADLSRATGTGVAQVSNWLINYRYVVSGELPRWRQRGRGAGCYRMLLDLGGMLGTSRLAVDCLASSWPLTL